LYFTSCFNIVLVKVETEAETAQTDLGNKNFMHPSNWSRTVLYLHFAVRSGKHSTCGLSVPEKHTRIVLPSLFPSKLAQQQQYFASPQEISNPSLKINAVYQPQTTPSPCLPAQKLPKSRALSHSLHH
jgi:hypothetical protein